jgi:putative component of membrane protein insertase Oxa1/YidC/SpoIIIJ protein YidD
MRQPASFSSRHSSINSSQPGIVDSLAIAAINGYQRYLSPYKGFRCAHRVLHQGESCSQYVKREVQSAGLLVALRRSRVRFAECKEASRVIQIRRRDYLISLSSEDTSDTNWDPQPPLTEAEEHFLRENEQERLKNNAASSNNCNNCDSPCIDAGCESLNCLSAVDCASCDLAGLDCGVLDACGGCSW